MASNTAPSDGSADGCDRVLSAVVDDHRMLTDAVVAGTITQTDLEEFLASSPGYTEAPRSGSVRSARILAQLLIDTERPHST